MAKKQTLVTAEMLREAYIANLEAKRKTNAVAIADFTERELSDFIRQYADSRFIGIFEELDHNYYDRVREKIATNGEMRTADKEADNMYSFHLKQWTSFLESKAFKELFKKKRSSDEKPKATDTAEPAKPFASPFREETEGERKHIVKEMDVVRRNPQLRQQCIDRYGYQCQCCGMNFAEFYGEELGANFIEVHHLKPISTYEEDGKPENFLENLVPLCSNCHSMIHHIKKSEHPLRDLREAYRGIKQEIAQWKED